MSYVEIRAAEQSDLPALEAVIESTDLFPREMLAPMMADYFAPPDSLASSPRPMWLALVDKSYSSDPIGVAYANYETLTDSTWNMLLIAVHQNLHGRGYGSKLLKHVESTLCMEKAARMMIIETSGEESFAGTREFYKKRGYSSVASIPDFYEDGNDKVVFCKRLATTGDDN